MRTRKAAKNLIIGIVVQVMTFILAWISRVIISRIMGVSYLGISGLYNDIFSVLSLSELGIGTAMLCALYKPAADGDKDHVRKILNYYRLLYILVAASIVAIGLILIPFLPYIVKGLDTVDHPYIYYLMYLIETVLTYLFSWKNSVLYVYQEQYIYSLVNGICQVLRYALQCFVLLITHNFIFYMIIQVTSGFLPYIIASIVATKRHPEELEARYGYKLPSKTERKALLSNVGAMSMHKVGGVLVNNTDSLIMSAFLGLASLGIYSNYRLIVNTLTRFMKQCVDAFAGGVGNLNVTEGSDKVYQIYNEIHFLCTVGYGYCTVMMMLLFKDYVLVGFGNDYLLSTITVIMICADFYTKGMRVPILTFRDAAGLFKYDKYKPVFEVIINLVTSIILVRNLGITGVIAGTLISFFTTSFWVDPLVLFKEGIKSDWHGKLKEYYKRYILDILVVVAECFICIGSMRVITYTGLIGLIIKGILGTAEFIVLTLIIYGNTREFRSIIDKSKKLTKK